MSEDFTPFFSGLDVKKVTFVTPKGNVQITAYFDNSFTNSQIGETVLDTTAPRLTCIQKDIKFMGEPKQFRGMPVIVDGVNFSAIQIQYEGTGLAIITLGHEE